MTWDELLNSVQSGTLRQDAARDAIRCIVLQVKANRQVLADLSLRYSRHSHNDGHGHQSCRPEVHLKTGEV